jgi:hypothetical protein
MLTIEKMALSMNDGFPESLLPEASKQKCSPPLQLSLNLNRHLAHLILLELTEETEDFALDFRQVLTRLVLHMHDPGPNPLQILLNLGSEMKELVLFMPHLLQFNHHGIDLSLSWVRILRLFCKITDMHLEIKMIPKNAI